MPGQNTGRRDKLNFKILKMEFEIINLEELSKEEKMQIQAGSWYHVYSIIAAEFDDFVAGFKEGYNY